MRTMEEFAAENHVPIVKPETAAFLRVITALLAPLRVLEIGTAIGYSALQICRCLPPEGRLTTIEQNERRLSLAREFFSLSGEEERIALLPGDARDILPGLEGPFDMVFMDAAKGQYPAFLPEALRLLRAGGVLITDNLFQDGTLLESRYAVARRDRTIHTRLRAYIKELKSNPDLETSILPVGDGVALSVKKGEPQGVKGDNS